MGSSGEARFLADGTEPEVARRTHHHLAILTYHQRSSGRPGGEVLWWRVSRCVHGIPTCSTGGRMRLT